jgi:hypothetical protein
MELRARTDFTKLAQATVGVYNAQTLFEGNNLGCFFFQAAQQGIPEALPGLLSDLAPVISLLNKWIDPVTTLLDCPALNAFNQIAFDQFPGSSYHPTS